MNFKITIGLLSILFISTLAIPTKQKRGSPVKRDEVKQRSQRGGYKDYSYGNPQWNNNYGSYWSNANNGYGGYPGYGNNGYGSYPGYGNNGYGSYPGYGNNGYGSYPGYGNNGYGSYPGYGSYFGYPAGYNNWYQRRK